MKLPLVKLEDVSNSEVKKEEKKAKDQRPREPFEYERYSDEELMDVYKHIDREAYPERFQKLEAEMEKRKKAEQGACH